ncbi:MAG: bifunctional methylenetetrahydrofolate dehydrogenase/methenyltetrahydrofolate cyclohydrolase FolD [Haloplasmataceae bacterium]|jgi:methylenetetrahydrofolate dehydrogenase (NADP+)/methenyltetrahydrofolate cyclohydrolase|nr:bifunctional methylenetetrahydrofolate dehydrogenase/methenyltetrahydrofolate cyclohydrolase FolD [Haloplasmataceae bacterium]
MSAKIISGKELANKLRLELKEKVNKFILKTQIQPHLVVVLVGNNPSSLSYVSGKQKGCEQVNIKSSLIQLSEETTQEELILLVRQLNSDKTVHGILVQLPLPKHINELDIINTINVDKDVDGFSPINVGKLSLNEDSLLPCTAEGIIRLIKETKVNISGSHAVVIGRSNIVGKPVSQLLLRENATVTVCHSKTKDIKAFSRNADILVVAIGKPKFVTVDMIKPGSVVIDVGTTRLDNGKFYGDVDYEKAVDVAGFITPVPGGVGPMTITILLENTFKACVTQYNKAK